MTNRKENDAQAGRRPLRVLRVARGRDFENGHDAVRPCAIDRFVGISDDTQALDRRIPPATFQEAVAYVAAYLVRHPGTWQLELNDGRPCHLAAALWHFNVWLRPEPGVELKPESPGEEVQPRGEGWSL